MQSFPIAAVGARPLWVLLPAFLIMLGASALLLASYLGARNARFELTSEGLRLRGDLYGRLVPRAALRVSEARRLTANDTELWPKLRTLGTGLPGYQAGWYRLQNGDKALVYLTDRERAVYVPTTEGYAVLVSPSDPDSFLAALGALR